VFRPLSVAISRDYHYLRSTAALLNSFIHLFIHWQVQNLTIPCRSQQLVPFFSVVYSLPPPSSPQLVFHPSFLVLFFRARQLMPRMHHSLRLIVQLHPSLLHLSISFSVYLSALLFPNSYLNFFRGFLFSSILCSCPNAIYLVLQTLL
jgi:hypothetical protein